MTTIEMRYNKNRLFTRSEEYVRSNRVSGILRVTKGDTYTEAKQLRPLPKFYLLKARLLDLQFDMID